MEKEEIKILRDSLKVALINSRSQMVLGRGFCPTCPLCENIIKEAPDMHEVLITRAMVRNSNEAWRIFNRHNCVLVHNPCHLVFASTKEGKARCIQQLIQYESASHIKAWLTEIKQYFPQQAQEATRFFQLEDGLPTISTPT